MPTDLEVIEACKRLEGRFEGDSDVALVVTAARGAMNGALHPKVEDPRKAILREPDVRAIMEAVEEGARSLKEIDDQAGTSINHDVFGRLIANGILECVRDDTELGTNRYRMTSEARALWDDFQNWTRRVLPL